jgi:hypothetical protein
MITTRHSICLLAFLVTATTTACGNESDSPAPVRSETKQNTDEGASQGATLTPGYLEGRWCYAYIDFGGQRENVGTEYVFNPDGTLEYQVNSLSGKMDSGSYSIEGGQIEIRPTMVMFDLMIHDVAENEFVLDAMGGKHHFLRGECTGSTGG